MSISRAADIFAGNCWPDRALASLASLCWTLLEVKFVACSTCLSIAAHEGEPVQSNQWTHPSRCISTVARAFNMKISILICKQQGHSNCAPSCNDILQHQNAATPSQGVCRSYPGKDRLAGSYKLLLLMLLALMLLPKLQALRLSCLCFGISLHDLFLHSCMFSLHLLDVIGPTWTDLPREQHCPLTAGCFHVDWHKLLSQQHNDDFSLGRNAKVCRQPSGYALYNRPITTEPMQQPSLTTSTTLSHRQYDPSWKASAEGTWSQSDCC